VPAVGGGPVPVTTLVAAPARKCRRLAGAAGDYAGDAAGQRHRRTVVAAGRGPDRLAMGTAQYHRQPYFRCHGDALFLCAQPVAAENPDRKSTRLNSSHVKI